MDPFVGFIDDDRTESGAKGVIKSAMIQSSKDDIFDFQNSPLEPNDVETVDKPGGKGFETAGHLEEDEFEAFRSTLNQSDAFTFQRNQEYWRADVDELPAPDPREVVKQREPTEVAQDRELKARVTTDVDKYASDPGSFDFPFVDTPPEFNDEFSRSTLAGTHIEGKSIFKEAGEDRLFEW